MILNRLVKLMDIALHCIFCSRPLLGKSLRNQKKRISFFNQSLTVKRTWVWFSLIDSEILWKCIGYIWAYRLFNQKSKSFCFWLTKFLFRNGTDKYRQFLVIKTNDKLSPSINWVDMQIFDSSVTRPIQLSQSKYYSQLKLLGMWGSCPVYWRMVIAETDDDNGKFFVIFMYQLGRKDTNAW